ncbi:MAG TPA: ABC transporter substrate-binding protein [Syntrophomonadaceae bacterium]|nr:ABC transporter substrate-binding protein [Syntrophomonadaceae bacterium]HPR92857.1 ABC transporter substrate-binding protein [Syntrophomonadaceae bacterium]
MKKFIGVLLLVVFMMVAVVGCEKQPAAEGDKAASDVKIHVGVVEPISGAQAALGQAEYDGIQMAIEMINEDGGVMGKYPITYDFADSQSDPATGASEAERLITSKNVPVIMGSYSSAIAASISEVAERNKVVLWEMSGSADSLLQKGYQWTFRNEANASAWGAESVEFLIANDAQIQEKLGKSSKDLVVAIVHEDGPYGTAVADGNRATAEKYGLKVAVDEAYSSKAVDLSSIITKVKAANPDVLLLTSYVNDAIMFNRQAKELGFKVPILITHSGGHSVQAFVDGVGADANYMLTVDPVPCNPNTEGFSEEYAAILDEFVNRWTEKYGVPPYHHVEYRQFAQTMLFFKEIVPAAIEASGEFTAQSVADAIKAANVPAENSLCGFGAKFSTPEKPWTDPWLGNKHTGQNYEARAFINQYFDGTLVTVWPENLAKKEAVLFLPAEHPLSANK